MEGLQSRAMVAVTGICLGNDVMIRGDSDGGVGFSLLSPPNGVAKSCHLFKENSEDLLCLQTLT